MGVDLGRDSNLALTFIKCNFDVKVHVRTLKKGLSCNQIILYLSLGFSFKVFLFYFPVSESIFSLPSLSRAIPYKDLPIYLFIGRMGIYIHEVVGGKKEMIRIFHLKES